MSFVRAAKRLCALLLLSAPVLAAGEVSPRAAPAFSIPDLNGRVASLTGYANRPVLLVFYRGFW